MQHRLYRPPKIILACARLSISAESARESGRAKQVNEKEGEWEREGESVSIV